MTFPQARLDNSLQCCNWARAFHGSKKVRLKCAGVEGVRLVDVRTRKVSFCITSSTAVVIATKKLRSE